MLKTLAILIKVSTFHSSFMRHSSSTSNRCRIFNAFSTSFDVQFVKISTSKYSYVFNVFSTSIRSRKCPLHIGSSTDCVSSLLVKVIKVMLRGCLYGQTRSFHIFSWLMVHVYVIHGRISTLLNPACFLGWLPSSMFSNLLVKILVKALPFTS